LLAALEGNKVLGKEKGKEMVRKVWEVRRERSGGGRVWMRFVHFSVQVVLTNFGFFYRLLPE